MLYNQASRALETTYDYLKVCPRYEAQRQQLNRTLAIIGLLDPSLNTLLFGGHDISDEDNKRIVEAVQLYIKCSCILNKPNVSINKFY